MTVYQPSEKLMADLALGKIAAIGRLISRAEGGNEEVRKTLGAIYKKAGRAHVIGITGVPGSGKSTLVANLTRYMREQGRTVAILAIDPSSPFSGGSILGDRIRMIEHGNDIGVYVRSMATRGATGGIARSTLEAVDILDVAGFDTVIIETVGVGQAEVEIVKASQTTIVVSAPGLGDEIQALKAGMLEIADIHVVSKCDRSDANRTITDLKQMLTLAPMTENTADWRPPVIGVSSFEDKGIDKLMLSIDEHCKVARETESGRIRQNSISGFRLQKTAESLLAERFRKRFAPLKTNLVNQLQDRSSDPYSLAVKSLLLSFGDDNET